MRESLVSIIVRTKDRPKLLNKALQSIASQTYRPIEVVLVNDGGCDLPEDELKEILGDVSLNYIRLKENKGRAGAGNVGIENAKGGYIGFLDDDDEFYPEHVSVLMEFSLKNLGKITYSACKIVYLYGENLFDSNTKENKSSLICSVDFSFDKLLVKNFIPFMCLLFPKETLNEINGLDESFYLYEDWDMLIRLAMKYQFCHLKEVTAAYYIWDRNLQITEQAKYSGQTNMAFSKIFYKHRDKFTHQTIQRLIREQEITEKKLEVKDDIIAHKEPEIQRILKEKDSIISWKDSEIQRTIEEKDSEIQRTIKEKDSEIRRVIVEKDFLLSEIYNSLGWRLLSKYRQLKDSLFPQGTRRRRFYDLTLKSIYVVRNEGLRRFLHKAKAKLPSEFSSVTEKRLESFLCYKVKALTMPKYENPDVSIIIPVFNKAVYTFNCLDSILKNTQDSSYEVIIVNNASTDNTVRVLEDIKNIDVVNNSENLGFVQACNAGAGVARGKYLVFLNNDTKVTMGWLGNLLEPAKNGNSVGIVGAKLLYPDGKLQEAGGIVWSDGSAWNYGLYDDPDKCDYNYLREVDYCSGACILVKKNLFEMVGGFDIRYSPAYYEDTDFAFTLRKQGYKTIYQPKAEIIHFEGATAGTDVTKGIKKFQEINSKKFIEKWKGTLVNEYLPAGRDVFFARQRDYRGKKRMLFIDHYVPTYDKDAGSVRTYEYLKIFLSLGFSVTFWPDNLARTEPYTSELQQMGIEVIYGNKNFNEYIEKFGRYFDIAFLSRPHIAIKYINEIKTKTGMKIIYDCHDLVFLREMRRANIENSNVVRETALKSKKDELYLSSISDAVVVLSSFERDLLLKEDPNIKVYLIPLVYPRPAVQVKPFNETEGLLFIAGFVHPPNEDAVLWFVDDVLPLIHKELPEVDFYIIGSHPPKRVIKLASKRVKAVGYVEDVSRFFRNSRVFVAPLIYGAGAKGKVIHSMSYGLPVVTTKIGVEGLDLTDGYDVIIADEPSEFAMKVVELYRNETLWNKISKNSLESMKNKFSAEIADKEFQKMFTDLGVMNVDANKMPRVREL